MHPTRTVQPTRRWVATPELVDEALGLGVLEATAVCCVLRAVALAGTTELVGPDTMLVPETVRPFPIVDTVVHEEEDGAGWGGGVAGSPWKKVEEP